MFWDPIQVPKAKYYNLRLLLVTEVISSVTIGLKDSEDV